MMAKTAQLRKNMAQNGDDGEGVDEATQPTLGEAIDFFHALTIKELEDLDGTKDSTLRRYYLSAGDVLWIPAGSILIEKAVQANSIGLRACSTFFHADQLRSLAICNDSEQKTLCLVAV